MLRAARGTESRIERTILASTGGRKFRRFFLCPSPSIHKSPLTSSAQRPSPWLALFPDMLKLPSPVRTETPCRRARMPECLGNNREDGGKASRQSCFTPWRSNNVFKASPVRRACTLAGLMTITTRLTRMDGMQKIRRADGKGWARVGHLLRESPSQKLERVRRR